MWVTIFCFCCKMALTLFTFDNGKALACVITEAAIEVEKIYIGEIPCANDTDILSQHLILSLCFKVCINWQFWTLQGSASHG